MYSVALIVLLITRVFILMKGEDKIYIGSGSTMRSFQPGLETTSQAIALFYGGGFVLKIRIENETTIALFYQ